MTDTIPSTSTPTNDVRARNKEILFAAAGITKVSIEFDGAGDSGLIEDILVWNAAGETIPLPSDRHLEPPLARTGQSAGTDDVAGSD